jgi:hypothetical protein
MFSAIERFSQSVVSCGTRPMPSVWAPWGEWIRTGRPSRRISPSSGATMPLRILSSVDLPAPFAPTSAWISAGSTSKLTPRTAWMPP